ncbi:GntR family transcriptional regulator [Glaciihabitans sp. UYNi722]|uniref:GntR family transcriptional regulator n=1 Tax=Glaciihabitans sp. UYNi722 TaxID=3156344 RepID=UPI00339B6F9A
MVDMSQTIQLYDRVRAAILALDLAPGERLTERGLEAEFAASRTPVRAALMRLDSEGLVQREGRGWIVAPIDTAEISALAELREAVESAGVRLSVQRASDADIEAIAELLNAGRPAADEEQGVRAGGDFHIELAQLSGNEFMVDTVRSAMTRLSRTRWLEVRTSEAREQAWREHREIVRAIASRDADSASSLVMHHIRGTNERLLDSLAADRQRLRGHGMSILQ